VWELEVKFSATFQVFSRVWRTKVTFSDFFWRPSSTDRKRKTTQRNRADDVKSAFRSFTAPFKNATRSHHLSSDSVRAGHRFLLPRECYFWRNYFWAFLVHVRSFVILILLEPEKFRPAFQTCWYIPRTWKRAESLTWIDIRTRIFLLQVALFSTEKKSLNERFKHNGIYSFFRHLCTSAFFIWNKCNT
jgi:hypothetical protein